MEEHGINTLVKMIVLLNMIMQDVAHANGSPPNSVLAHPPPSSTLSSRFVSPHLDGKPKFFIKFCAKICEKACSREERKHKEQKSELNGYGEFVPVGFMKCTFDCVEECVSWFKFT
jgi:hypothetical protein